MTLFGAVCYGVLQGISEFLPISSSGHLALAQNFDLFSGTGSDMTFNVLLHLGTLMSVLAVFRRDVISMASGAVSLLKRPFKKEKTPLSDGERTFLYVCAASVMLLPAALLGDTVERVSHSSTAVGILLMINGLMLLISEKLSSGRVPLTGAGCIRAFIVGAFQAAGVLPGISRSGATLTGGLICGLNAKDAVRFSFLMSIPAITGAGIMELKNIGAGVEEGMLGIYAAGAFTAFAVGTAAAGLLRYLADKKGFLPFTVYCLAIGAAAVIADMLL